MASMAAAIAASRTAALISGGGGGNRPLDERERKRFSYFSSLSPMARRIMAEKERVRQRHGTEWERLPTRHQDQALDRGLAGAHAQASYPNLRLNTGQKVVHFGEEDITWQDEHSAPFSWETKSQMEFSMASLSIQEVNGVATQNEQKQPPKTAPAIPASKPSQGVKAPGSDGQVPVRKEEESTFWKINAERSKCEGEKIQFYSLTPSQIKSMEKGEKNLQPYYRQESGAKEAAKAEKPSVVKLEKSAAPAVPTTSIEWEKPQLSLPSVGALDAPPEPEEKLSSGGTEDTDSGFLSDLQTVSQSNVILKTGFDFLDNW